MRIHYILHASFEKLGIIDTWVNQRRHALSGTHTYRNESLPAMNEFDMLIIMGGPQSMLEIDRYPYLRNEIAFTKEAIRENKVVLGVCLGAQIIGEALGAKAQESPQREIGVYPIQLTPEAKTDPLFKQFPPQFDVMHWHGDMPGMPEGAVLLAKSPGCPRQAFRYGDRVYGFQFHLEFTPELIRQMVHHCHDELTAAQYVQPPSDLLKQDLISINQKMIMTLDYLASCVSLINESFTKDNV